MTFYCHWNWDIETLQISAPLRVNVAITSQKGLFRECPMSITHRKQFQEVLNTVPNFQESWTTWKYETFPSEIYQTILNSRLSSCQRILDNFLTLIKKLKPGESHRWELSLISMICDIGLSLISELPMSDWESGVRHYIGYRNKVLSHIASHIPIFTKNHSNSVL